MKRGHMKRRTETRSARSAVVRELRAFGQSLLKAVLSRIGRNSCRIDAVKAGTAITFVPGELPEAAHREKTERIGADHLCDFVDRMMASDQIIP